MRQVIGAFLRRAENTNEAEWNERRPVQVSPVHLRTCKRAAPTVDSSDTVRVVQQPQSNLTQNSSPFQGTVRWRNVSRQRSRLISTFA